MKIKMIIMALIIVAIMLCTLLYTCKDYLNNDIIEVTIKEEYIKRSGDNDKYMVVDEDLNTYVISDLFFKFKFNSTDIYNSLDEGLTYQLKVSGFRIPLFSSYKNINEVMDTLD